MGREFRIFSLVLSLILSPLTSALLIIDSKQTPKLSLIALVPRTKCLNPTVSVVLYVVQLFWNQQALNWLRKTRTASTAFPASTACSAPFCVPNCVPTLYYVMTNGRREFHAFSNLCVLEYIGHMWAHRILRICWSAWLSNRVDNRSVGFSHVYRQARNELCAFWAMPTQNVRGHSPRCVAKPKTTLCKRGGSS